MCGTAAAVVAVVSLIELHQHRKPFTCERIEWETNSLAARTSWLSFIFSVLSLCTQFTCQITGVMPHIEPINMQYNGRLSIPFLALMPCVPMILGLCTFWAMIWSIYNNNSFVFCKCLSSEVCEHETKFLSHTAFRTRCHPWHIKWKWIFAQFSSEFPSVQATICVRTHRIQRDYFQR